MTRRGLSRKIVADTAVAIVESDGPQALTLSRVATTLGVKPPSLYNHVEDLEMIRRDVALRAVEALTDLLGSAAMGRAGGEALRAVAAAFRAYAREHPGLYELSAQARPEDEEYTSASLAAIEPVLAVLRGFSLDDRDVIHAARGLRAALHGFVALERVGGFGLDVDIDDSFDWLVERLAEALEGTPHRRDDGR